MSREIFALPICLWSAAVELNTEKLVSRSAPGNRRSRHRKFGELRIRRVLSDRCCLSEENPKSRPNRPKIAKCRVSAVQIHPSPPSSLLSTTFSGENREIRHVCAASRSCEGTGERPSGRLLISFRGFLSAPK
jgi:hypothetical protein